MKSAFRSFETSRAAKDFVTDVMDGYFPWEFNESHPDGVYFTWKDYRDRKCPFSSKGYSLIDKIEPTSIEVLAAMENSPHKVNGQELNVGSVKNVDNRESERHDIVPHTPRKSSQFLTNLSNPMYRVANDTTLSVAEIAASNAKSSTTGQTIGTSIPRQVQSPMTAVCHAMGQVSTCKMVNNCCWCAKIDFIVGFYQITVCLCIFDFGN